VISPQWARFKKFKNDLVDEKKKKRNNLRFRGNNFQQSSFRDNERKKKRKNPTQTRLCK